MNVLATGPRSSVVYPESDGKPMSDNTRHARWIFVFFGNLSALFDAVADVFVAADLLWYPVEMHNKILSAPDVMVVFGRPKGDRGSYCQWEEDGVPVTVVFEIVSPSNKALEWVDKHLFYEDHGVEEYYLYDPETDSLIVYLRRNDMLRPQRAQESFVSPRLGIRFDLTGSEMQVFYPDGSPFLTFEQLKAAMDKARQERDLAAQQRDEASRQRDLAAQQRDEASRQRDLAAQRADRADQRAARLAELTRKVLQQQATAEETQELQRLLQPD